VNERPIIFSGPMVRALLASTKTQTRRIPTPANSEFSSAPALFWKHADFSRAFVDGTGSGREYLQVPAHVAPGCEGCADYDWQGTRHRLWFRSSPGDHLWVKETHSTSALGVYPCPDAWYRADFGTHDDPAKVDGLHDRGCTGNRGDCFACVEQREGKFRWRPSIHMPRKLSRLTLEVTEVRVQRLQDISEEDAKAEGVEPYEVTSADIEAMEPGPTRDLAESLGPGWLSRKAIYASLWDSLNAKRAPWDSNPWVWAVTFRRAA
jgi:hypothetical protein